MVAKMAREEYMRLAIGEAWKGVERGQEPYGACVVREGEVVSLAHNTVREDLDVTAHAEMNALRDACKKLETVDLSGCEIYATFKPCPMCQSACERANISRIYYGVGPDDIGSTPRELGAMVIAGFLRDECMELVRPR